MKQAEAECAIGQSTEPQQNLNLDFFYKEESVAVHLRLARTGRHKRPMYRLVAADSRKARDGRFIEILGIFDPLKEAGLPELKQERVLTWLHQGAQPTVTVRTLLRRSGVWKQFEAEKLARKAAAAK